MVLRPHQRRVAERNFLTMGLSGFLDFANFVHNERGAIFLLSSVTAASFALVILLPRYESQLLRRWANYFGWAFFIFAVQYASKFFAWWFTGEGEETPFGVTLFFQLCSCLNSILF